MPGTGQKSGSKPDFEQVKTDAAPKWWFQNQIVTYAISYQNLLENHLENFSMRAIAQNIPCTLSLFDNFDLIQSIVSLPSTGSIL